VFHRSKEPILDRMRTRKSNLCPVTVAVNCGIEIHRHGVPCASSLYALRRSRLCKVKSWQHVSTIRLRAPHHKPASSLCRFTRPADEVDWLIAGESSAGWGCLCVAYWCWIIQWPTCVLLNIHAWQRVAIVSVKIVCVHNIHLQHQCDLQDYLQ